MADLPDIDKTTTGFIAYWNASDGDVENVQLEVERKENVGTAI